MNSKTIQSAQGQSVKLEAAIAATNVHCDTVYGKLTDFVAALVKISAPLDGTRDTLPKHQSHNPGSLNNLSLSEKQRLGLYHLMD